MSADIDFSKVIELAYEKLESPKIGNNCVRSRCPLCGDSKTKSNVRRFYIDYYAPYNDYITKCFRCGKSLNITSLYAFLYDTSYTDAKKALEGKQYDPEKIRNKLEKKQKGNRQETKQSAELDINIERECYSIYSNPAGKTGKRCVEALNNFQKERGVKGCFIAHSGRYQGRVIIPVYYKGELIYFQGRALFDEMHPKYLNPAVEKEGIIPNQDKFDSEKSIIVTEGLLDAYTIGDQGTSPLGVSINDDFLLWIRRLTKESVILALDNHRNDSASYEQLTKISQKSSHAKLINYFLFPKKYERCKDINELVASGEINKDEVFDFIIDNSVSYERMSVMVKFGGYVKC